ncbi:Ubiquinone/menaquinone biosynthesis C-methyltransferase UbiE [Novipirellula aureliae]|uniref:Ubiquinone/menaquinone biosynthesis C-methyltransferase UbiE n=1 Tax=Novipirellula aureliae TaxID=2527966 RepID=A0A5C6E3B7_9BACT|nr:class I SAM-dependent methyltransferase [Novipirellula aureliae]TWU44163.1 Ubiquinone/menaquinone biosynthesis C-methyltransferase UbiE [Novipirellula aureliae]
MSEVIKPVSRRSDLRVLWHLLCHPVRGDSHAQRLENFYQGQAGDYDSFRARLLHGRAELLTWIDWPVGGTWVDMGAGTGHNLFSVADQTTQLDRVCLVDLSPSLLEVAKQRVGSEGITNVEIMQADATRVDLPDASVDVVTFSYSLTMIPDWFEAIATAERILKPGGTIAVTDFYVSRKYADAERQQHGWLRRTFWPLWFAADNVFLNGDHLAMLHRRFEPIRCEERQGSVPYLPLLKAPYYLLIARKPMNDH